MPAAARSAFRAAIMTPAPEGLRHWPDGLLIVEAGMIEAVGAYHDLAPRLGSALTAQEFPGRIIVPGFVDSHLHFPQIDQMGAFGAQLLDWLDRFIYPAEARFADKSFATEAARFFVGEMLRHGITSGLVFATSSEASVEALFAAARARNMRLISGLTLMDRGAPDALLLAPAPAAAASERLIRRHHGRGRLGYAVTPRFAPTASPEMLAMAGALHRAHPETLVHTHLSENEREIALVRALFPDCAGYWDVYRQAGLGGSRSVFAHCVHLADEEWRALAAADCAIAFCPCSNLFLGSGLFDLAQAQRLGIRVGLGSDIGAGDSLSPFAVQKDAYRVGQLRAQTLNPLAAFRLATLGGAEALRIADRVGSLEAGKEADFLLLDPGATPLLRRRLASGDGSPEDCLFALGILGDDRAVAATYVAGRCVHRRAARPFAAR